MFMKLPNLPNRINIPEPSGKITKPQLRYGKRIRSNKNPQKSLTQSIAKSFGTFENFKETLTAAAVAGQGSGWTLLAWSPYFHDLEIIHAEDSGDLEQWGVIPLLAVDAWKHEYYLKYQNKQTLWVVEWWMLVNWEDVDKRYRDIVHEYKKLSPLELCNRFAMDLSNNIEKKVMI